MFFHREMAEIKKKLEERGHTVLLPHIEYGDFHKLRDADEKKWSDLKPKLMRKHFDRVRNSDAILVLNYDKDAVKNYIGGNSLLELGIAFDLKKKIFLLNPIPKDLPYTEEIEVIKPIVINGDLSEVK